MFCGVMRDLEVLAKYPFLSEAKQYIRELGPSVDELLSDPVFSRARSRGIERVQQSIKKNSDESFVVGDEVDCIMELLSYPVARMVVVSVGDEFFLRRYCHFEAYRAYRLLLLEDPLFLVELARQYKLNVKSESNSLLVYFRDYLAFAPTTHRVWKMVNREIRDGFVVLTARETSRLLLEVLRSHFVDELKNLLGNQRIYESFSKEIDGFRQYARSLQKNRETAPIGRVDVELMPPCLKSLLAAMQKGENVPHMGRFAVVSFLSALGLKSEDILKIFSTAPDFDVERSRYQVEHITGSSSSTSYKAPGCDKMKTFGLCASDGSDQLCRRAKTPLWYYQQKWRQEKKRKDEK